ncbi:hypothetical protein SAMN05216266_1515 [Amycolatopsis marina]|uniref:Putative T7SS secretion signal domain-containing protein n=1 Tax=Amycolatopsis marina TaxID=490629 RepID=A0A1I1CX33_9PSEU|nr:hypothetical protein SAMN05216266_1515 [Amycolatopsis marina]
MAELGRTTDPRALVPGRPEAIEENVVVLRDRHRTMDDVAEGLAAIDSGGWTGPAGEAFREKFTYEPVRWRTAADAFTAAADALATHADTLRWAQAQAGEAIHRWQQGEVATREARASHDVAVAQANAQNQANTAAGNPTCVTVAPFTDPGEAHRTAARDILNRARNQLTESGERAAAAIRVQGDVAPDEPGWLAEVAGFAGEIGIGAWEGVTGLADMVVTYSPNRLLVDPQGWAEDMGTLAQGFVGAVQNPAEFGKALIDYDTWKQSPGRAIGHLIPDAIAAAATAGTGAAAIRAGRGAVKGAERAADVVDEAGDAAKVGERGAWAGGLTVSEQRAVRSLEKQVSEHQDKLAAYRANPDAFDNKGILKNAPTPEIRQRIIDGRIRHLEAEIKTFQRQIDDIQGGG